MSNASHHPTFEVGPAETVDGEQVRLVYTRVRDDATDADLRVQALSIASQVERFVFRKEEDRDGVGHIIEAAERFLTFLEGGESA